jgi:hypothetical protein
VTVYVVLAANPFNTMVPVDEAHCVGLVKLELLITGVGFTTTGTPPGSDGQFPVVAVAITL